MSNHYKEVCSCGALLGQCRCPGPKAIRTKLRGCDRCKDLDLSCGRPTCSFGGTVWNVAKQQYFCKRHAGN